MIENSPEFDTRVYFGKLAVLLVEANALEAEIIVQVLTGFKVRHVARFETAAQARDHLQRAQAELIIVGTAHAGNGEMDEYDFIRWLRRNRIEAIKTAAIILLTGHTSEANVLRARDCGASFIIAKPITPRVIYDRVVWLAKDGRPFIDSETYAGPDRRFQKLGPPPNTEGRRKDDLSLKIGDAKEPNMSQNEIDALLNAKGAPR